MTQPIRIKASLRKGGKPVKAAVPAKGRIPRVTKLLALAHRFEQLLRDGVVKDYAELARLGHVTRARVTQIMNLLNLAPKIQEEILSLPPVQMGKDLVTERQLRAVVDDIDWRRQERCWHRLKAAYNDLQT